MDNPSDNTPPHGLNAEAARLLDEERTDELRGKVLQNLDTFNSLLHEPTLCDELDP